MDRGLELFKEVDGGGGGGGGVEVRQTAVVGYHSEEELGEVGEGNLR